MEHPRRLQRKSKQQLVRNKNRISKEKSLQEQIKKFRKKKAFLESIRPRRETDVLVHALFSLLEEPASWLWAEARFLPAAQITKQLVYSYLVMLEVGFSAEIAQLVAQWLRIAYAQDLVLLRVLFTQSQSPFLRLRELKRQLEERALQETRL